MNKHHRVPEGYEPVRNLPPKGGGFDTFTAASLADEPVPEREWLVENLIPARTVTLLSGDGGVGKSLLALQLAAAMSSGGYWIGRAVQPGQVLFVTAEDEKDEVHRRLVDVADDLQVSLRDLTRLSAHSLAGKDAVLAAPDGRTNILRPTKVWGDLAATLMREGPRLVVLDTLADFFGGLENDRAQARQFIGLMRRLCANFDTTILLLSHPSLSGMANGSGLSGSTAWNNSVRSRLYFERVKGEGGEEDDRDLRVLTTKKANYAAMGETISVRWRRGVFTAKNDADSFTAIAAQAKADRVFLNMLEAYQREGRTVTAQPGHGYAPKMFAEDKRAEGVTKREMTDAMNRLLPAGRIEVEEYGYQSNRKRRLVLARRRAE